MQVAALSLSPEDPAEERRLTVLRSLELLNSAPDPAFDRIAGLAQRIAATPVALLSFIDSEQQWFKARRGTELCSSPRSISFCNHAIAQSEVLWLEDTRLDPRFTANPLVAGPPFVRFYAGTAIVVDGQAIGSLCVIGFEPRTFDAHVEQALTDLAAVAGEQCRLHRTLRQVSEAERTVESTHARYRSLFRSTSEPMVVLDVGPAGEFVFVDINPAMKAVTQLKRGDVVGRTPQQVFGESGDWLESQYRICAETEAPHQFVAEIPLPGGSRTLDTLISPLRESPDGRVSGLLISARDVTEAHAAQTALRLSSDRFARVFESSADALCEVGVVDGSFVFEGVNAAYERATGLTAEETVGRSFREVFPPTLADEAERVCQECLATEAPVEHETLVPLLGGLRHWMVTMSPLRDRHDAVVRVLVSIKDISERKLLESRRREGQKLEAIGQLAGGLAHDFNNLLQVIDGYSRRALPAAPGEMTEVLKATERGTRLVRQLLVFSCRQVSDPEPVELSRALDDVMGFIQPLLGARYQVRLEVDEDAADLCVETDPNEFCQAMLNFASNARDAMADGGELVIRLSRAEPPGGRSEAEASGAHAVVRITDTGCGIEPAVAQRIFDPFYTTKDQGKGTGLGLSMVYGYAQQSGGSVEVSSTPGVGSTFSLHLPLTDKAPSLHADEDAGDLMGAGQTILLVEDDPALLELAQEILESLDYFVLTAQDGEQGLEAAAEWGDGVDLIVSDIIMPVMGGLQMTERLRRGRPGLPVVFMSGHPVRGDLQTFELPAGSAFLQKPYKPADLAKSVRRALSKTPELQLAS